MNIHIIGQTAIDHWTKTVLEMDRIIFTDFVDAAVVVVGDEDTLLKSLVTDKHFIFLSNAAPLCDFGQKAVWVTISNIVDYLKALANPSGRVTKEIRIH